MGLDTRSKAHARRELLRGHGQSWRCLHPASIHAAQRVQESPARDPDHHEPAGGNEETLQLLPGRWELQPGRAKDSTRFGQARRSPGMEDYCSQRTHRSGPHQGK